MPAQVKSGYAFLNCPEDKGSDQTQPVNSIYGVVQAPTGNSRPPQQTVPEWSERQSYTTTSQSTSEASKKADVSDQRPPISPRRNNNFNRSNSVPDSSYEFVELPTRINSLPRGNYSTPISIPSQHRSLPRATNYDTVVSPPLRRADPIGASTSPYGNVNIAKSDEDRKEGDGLARGLPEIRSDPEGAKKRDLQSPPTRMADYENVVLPPRTGSMSSQKETVYENMPVSPPTYEYNVPRPQPRPALGVNSSSDERDRYKS